VSEHPRVGRCQAAFCTALALSLRNARLGRPYFQQFFGAMPRRNRPHGAVPVKTSQVQRLGRGVIQKVRCAYDSHRHLVSRFEKRLALAGDRRFESCSLQQTVRLSPASAIKRREPRPSARVCAAGLTTGSAETRMAFHFAPTAGNISVGPYFRTAVPLMGAARLPRWSQRSRAFPSLMRVRS
jgi:hypothetical protein